ncbi:hypothetical protein Glove_1g5 [Diversispora epigaea]|uniref:Uncharacterized protein n=1 Tax=Diversispora epigaea TaxID=1348612 RepID=A0A397K0I9_9GLOM|nr:hypothetical protein Glove_1g5 [Diversispora epigaea]
MYQSHSVGQVFTSEKRKTEDNIQESLNKRVMTEYNDGYKTPLPRPRNETVMTTPQKPTLFENSVKYLDKHFSVNINHQCVMMKEKQVDTIAIPELVYN